MDYHLFEKLFTEEECHKILNDIHPESFKSSTVYNKKTHSCTINLKHRNSEVAEMRDEELSKTLMSKLCSKSKLIDKSFRIPRDFRIIRYQKGGFFGLHRDMVIRKKGYIGRYNIIIYLSDNYKGGETTFIDEKTGLQHPIKGKTGDVLMFDPTILHRGSSVESGIKNILIVQIYQNNTS